LVLGRRDFLSRWVRISSLSARPRPRAIPIRKPVPEIPSTDPSARRSADSARSPVSRACVAWYAGRTAIWLPQHEPDWIASSRMGGTPPPSTSPRCSRKSRARAESGDWWSWVATPYGVYRRAGPGRGDRIRHREFVCEPGRRQPPKNQPPNCGCSRPKLNGNPEVRRGAGAVGYRVAGPGPPAGSIRGVPNGRWRRRPQSVEAVLGIWQITARGSTIPSHHVSRWGNACWR